MEQSEKQNASSDLSATLEGILANPAMMSMISSMASQLKGSGGFDASPSPIAERPTAEEDLQDEEAVSASASATTDSKLPDAISAIAPLLSSGFSKKGVADDRRVCLLRALKPYMSEGRGEAIETIIKISKISEVFKNLT